MREELGRANDGEDPDRTDTMPLLQPTAADLDVADDAVPLQGDPQGESDLARAGHAPRETARAAAEAAARQDEVVRSLRDALGAREATIAELRKSQREREAREAREAREVREARAAAHSAAAAQHDGDAAQHHDHAEELAAARRALGRARARATAYFECLQTRAWRLDYFLSMFPARDASPFPAGDTRVLPADVTPAGQQTAAAEAGAELPISVVPPAAEADGPALQVAALERDKAQLAHALAAATARLAEQTAEIARLKGDAERTNEEMSVLLAHLRAARGPAPSESTAVQQLTEELTGARARLDAIDRENHDLKAALERLHASMQAADGWGGGEGALGEPGGMEDYGAELVRLGDDAGQVFALGRRTRIGRATGCEMQIESSSVSRHHALVLIGPQGAIIEDLHSTNGVFVNGRKVIRQWLHDADILTIGESKFQFTARPAARPRG
ncbi:MAG TPA: FHA domain-containing protein [Steroidobacteraceae bacterium]|nr:FHA domain-containing protein [Steroidobacteraceae bacterium]